MTINFKSFKMKKLLIPALLLIGIFAAYWAAFGNPITKIFGTKSPDVPPAKVAGSVSTKTGSFLPSPEIVQDKNGFPLMAGSRGDYVKQLQQALNDRYGSELVIDGVFGTKTAKALSAHGFNPSAIYYKHYNEILGK